MEEDIHELKERVRRIENALNVKNETYAHFHGKEYKVDFFGDIYFKDEFGAWVPVENPTP